VIPKDLADEFIECTTTRTRWWAVKFEGGAYFGDVIDDNPGGFDLKLFKNALGARCAALEFLECEDIPFEVVEINWSEV